MYAHARIRLPSGAEVDLSHGDIVGRIWNAALQIDDPRVSEAHALLSLRGKSLYLLGLRGRFAVEGRPTEQVELRAGLRVELARGLALDILEVTLPERVLALSAKGMPQQVLHGTSSLRTSPAPDLIPGRHADARAILWHVAGEWRVQPQGKEAMPLEPGIAFTLDGVEFRVSTVPVRLEGGATVPDQSLSAPLRIVTRWDTVHLHREGREPFILGGIAARILSELAAMEVPVDWNVLAEELWPTIDNRKALRKRLDIALARLRRKLRDASIRADLVRSSGAGLYELLLLPSDTVDRQD